MTRQLQIRTTNMFIQCVHLHRLQARLSLAASLTTFRESRYFTGVNFTRLFSPRPLMLSEEEANSHSKGVTPEEIT